MGIQVTCSACGRQVNIKEKYAGRIGGCPHCKAPIRVPAAAPKLDTFSLGDTGPDEDDDEEADVIILEEPERPARSSLPSPKARSNNRSRENVSDRADSISFYCPKCHRRMKVGARSAGKKTECNGCGQRILIPEAEEPLATSPPSDWDELLDQELPLASPVATGGTLQPLPALPKGKAPRRGSGSIESDWATPLAIGLFVAIVAIGFAYNGVYTAASFGCLYCWICVVVAMFRHGRTTLGLISIFPCGGSLIAFTIGWKKFQEWNLGLIMLTWTICIVVAMVAVWPLAMQRAAETQRQRQSQRQGPVAPQPVPPGFYK